MSAIQLDAIGGNAFTTIKITITRVGADGRAIAVPDDLQDMVIPDVDGKKGVVIDGAAPIWVHSAIAHAYHATAWVAHNDPRLGAIVVQSHVPDVLVGSVVK